VKMGDHPAGASEANQFLSGRKIVAVINRKSGTIAENPELSHERGMDRLFKEAGISADVHLVTPSQFEMELHRAADSDSEVIVVGGGDGSVNTAANIIRGTRKILGVLPMGTLNNFAKSVGMPADVSDAVKALARSVTLSVDLGEVNGMVFVNNSSIGIYPEAVRMREQYMEKLGIRKYTAMTMALMILVWDLRILKLQIETGGKNKFIKTPFFFLGNNLYDPKFLSYAKRESLSDGVLSVFYSHGIGRFGLSRIAFMAALGQLKKLPEVKIFEAPDLTVKSRYRWLRVSRDGEIGWMTSPLHYRILPKAIHILSPTKEQ
jgi:diacylglycerol kinase family enzyme